ncbi:MAG: hypothetical protein Q7R41_01205 [Phycisphaerales bacterium]|nr:hypothetical protein [Phycisphaerales bacterium]
MSTSDEGQPVKLYAFWRYDLYPFVLGGPVTQMRGDGCVETSNFGCGYWFKPIQLLPLEEGRKLHDALDALDKEHAKAQRKFNKEWRAKVDALLASDNT